MSREGARGQEYNGGSPDSGNAPDHTTILPFTRLLSGPFDYTPGVVHFDYRATRPDNRVPSTIANQLALYVVLYSPVQMAVDLPEHYDEHADAFHFIRDVPTDWEDSRTLQERSANMPSSRGGIATAPTGIWARSPAARRAA